MYRQIERTNWLKQRDQQPDESICSTCNKMSYMFEEAVEVIVAVLDGCFRLAERRQRSLTNERKEKKKPRCF